MFVIRIWWKYGRNLFFNMDERKSLSLRGSAKVNHADVVGGGHGFTLVLRLRGRPNEKSMNPLI